MRKLKLFLQIFIAFIIAAAAYAALYTPNQETVQAAVRKVLPQTEQQTAIPEGRLRITVLDVGQGDAILLQDGKRNVMVDVGDGRNRAQLEQELQKAGVDKINTVIVSHHHEDHMGNILQVAGKYGVSRIYDNGLVNEKNTTSVKLDKILRAGNYKNKVLKAGDIVYIDKGYYFEVLSPGDFVDAKLLKNLNNGSLVMKLHYGQFTMLFTGDAEKQVEGLLADKYGAELKSDVLKVGHHGSRTSSIYQFISKVQPSYALISCGPYEIYHHPNKNVVGSLQHLGAKVYTTIDNGSLTVNTDGKTFSVTTEK